MLASLATAILHPLGFGDTRVAAAEVSRLEAALHNITTLVRPGMVGYATAWDGNKYIQCRRLPTQDMRCEAAGALLQPSLARVLSAERLQRLAELGWTLDPSFGNHVRTFAAGMPTDDMAHHILGTLTDVYAVDVSRLEFATSWVDDVPCPPRNGFSQNLAGMINDAPAMQATSIRARAYVPEPPGTDDEDAPGCAGGAGPAEAAPAGHTVLSIDAVLALYCDDVAGEIQRLRINADRHVYAVFATATGYVQCMPNGAAGTLYCEALSEESWPGLTAILTPERIAWLHARGYADPGRAQNYSKDFALDSLTDAEIAAEILRTLFVVYGYRGDPPLDVETE